MRGEKYLLCKSENETVKEFKERMKANARISKMLEQYNNMKKKMRELYNTVQVGTIESERQSAYDELKILCEKVKAYAIENNLSYSDPIDMYL